MYALIVCTDKTHFMRVIEEEVNAYMNVVVEIHFISNENKVMQRGSFPLRKRKPEQVAFDFWKQVRREMPFGAQLSKLLIDGGDKTEILKEMK